MDAFDVLDYFKTQPIAEARRALEYSTLIVNGRTPRAPVQPRVRPSRAKSAVDQRALIEAAEPVDQTAAGLAVAGAAPTHAEQLNTLAPPTPTPPPAAALPTAPTVAAPPPPEPPADASAPAASTPPARRKRGSRKKPTDETPVAAAVPPPPPAPPPAVPVAGPPVVAAPPPNPSGATETFGDPESPMR